MYLAILRQPEYLYDYKKSSGPSHDKAWQLIKSTQSLIHWKQPLASPPQEQSKFHSGDESIGYSRRTIDDVAVELHYYWCARSDFMFRHYLALIAAVRKFQPFIIHFYAKTMPQSAPYSFEWFEDAKQQIRQLELHEQDNAACVEGEDLPTVEFIAGNLNIKCRNVIVQQDAVVNSRFERRLKRNDNDSDILIGDDNFIHYINASSEIELNLKYIRCQSVTFESLLDKNCFTTSPKSLCSQQVTYDDVCLQLSSDVFVRELPAAQSPLAAFIRYIYYGHQSPIFPTLHEHNVVPNLAHYAYVTMEEFEEKELDFAFYLSILGVLNIIKADCVYIHGNVKFGGMYWEDLSRRQLCVRWRYFPRPRYVWQQEPYHLVHFADVIRAQIFTDIGGIHVDPDAFFYRPVPKNFWRYDTVIGLDAHVAAPRLEHIPRLQRSEVNLGICFSAPHSGFFEKYRQSQKQFYGNLWTYNSGTKPLHIYERNPNLAHLSTRLMVICAGGMCYPNWAKNDDEARYLGSNTHLWFDEVHALHVVWPDMPEFSQPQYIRNATSIFGLVAKKILVASEIDLSELELLFANNSQVTTTKSSARRTSSSKRYSEIAEIFHVL